MNTKIIGDQFEASALSWWLERFPESKLIDQNFRIKGGEVDLIFEVPGTVTTLVFVEVRGRAAKSVISPIDSIHQRKIARIEKAAQVFLSKYRGGATQVRFDYLFKMAADDWVHLRG